MACLDDIIKKVLADKTTKPKPELELADDDPESCFPAITIKSMDALVRSLDNVLPKLNCKPSTSTSTPPPPPPSTPPTSEIDFNALHKRIIKNLNSRGIPKYCDELGSGASGIVWKIGIYEYNIPKSIALKIIRFGRDNKKLHQIMLEANTQKALNHKNIIKVYDYFVKNGSVYIYMEYVDGNDLLSIVEKGASLSSPTILNLFKQIMDGVKEIHEFGIIHNDLKLENIMLSRDGDIKICDFGLCAIGPNGFGDCGSIHYVPPEKFTSFGHKSYTYSVDLWSCGVILYTLVTGYFPYTYKEGKTSIEYYYRSLLNETPAYRLKDPKFYQIVKNLLQVNPAMRFYYHP